LYVYDPNPHLKQVNLLDTYHNWKSTKNLNITNVPGNLKMLLIANGTESRMEYAYLGTQSDISEVPILLSINYASKSITGTATFMLEIYDVNEQKRIYSRMLNDTTGNFTEQSFTLPRSILLSKYLEFRFYILPNDPGNHILDINKITLS
jgi:hypothetical protein